MDLWVPRVYPLDVWVCPLDLWGYPLHLWDTSDPWLGPSINKEPTRNKLTRNCNQGPRGSLQILRLVFPTCCSIGIVMST